MDCIDQLLLSGNNKDAWSKARLLLKTKPIGPESAGLILYLLPLTIHYDSPAKMAQFIRQYKKQVAANTRNNKLDNSFLAALDLIFTSITDRHNLQKIDSQIKAVDWSHLENQAILQTFRFSIESLRNNHSEAKKAIICAINSSNNPYEKALIAAAISWREAQKKHFQNSLSTAKRSLCLLKEEQSLRNTLLETQLLGHIGKIYTELGLNLMAQKHSSKMTTLINDSRSIYPAQKYFSSNIAAATKVQSPSKVRKLISAQLSTLSMKWPYQRSAMVQALFSLNELAIKCRDFQGARSALRSIRKLLPIKNRRELSGYYYRELAKLTIYAGNAKIQGSAFTDQILQKAETIFSSLGSKGWHGLATTVLIKGELLLEKKEYLAVQKCISRSLSLAKSLQDNNLFTYSTLLSSILLSEQGVNDKEAIYEDILCKLQEIKHPLLLFRILSNLYLYSWKASRSDESCQIIKTIHSLKTVLPALTFRQLWKTYLSDIVFSQLSTDLHAKDYSPARLC